MEPSGAALILLNRATAFVLSLKRIKAARTVMTIPIASAAAAPLASRMLHADDRPPPLIETHRTAGLKCAQCAQAQPPRLAPPNTTCLGCHGDQLALANRSKGANPTRMPLPIFPRAKPKSAPNVILSTGSPRSPAALAIANSIST